MKQELPEEQPQAAVQAVPRTHVRPAPIGTLLVLATLLCYSAPLASCPAAEPPGPLTTIAAVKGLPPEQATHQLPVRIGGVVTWVNPVIQVVLLQDGIAVRKYTQADSTIARRDGGTGLGLVIATESSELMAGETGATSDLRVGSESGRADARRGATRLILMTPQGGHGPEGTGERIKPIQDNIVNQEVALGIVRKLGLPADAAAAGLEALAALVAGDYDLVLRDVQVPERNGLEATRIIRNPQSDVRQHPILVIAMTANAMRGDREPCLEAGRHGYVAKPVSLRALSEAFNTWLPEADEASGEPARAPASSAASRTVRLKARGDSDHG